MAAQFGRKSGQFFCWKNQEQTDGDAYLRDSSHLVLVPQCFTGTL